jgi:malonyl CoA-acyl carrier protein transacylase
VIAGNNAKNLMREDAIKLVISAVQAAPETVPKDTKSLADYLIAEADKIIKYINQSP